MLAKLDIEMYATANDHAIKVVCDTLRCYGYQPSRVARRDEETHFDVVHVITAWNYDAGDIDDITNDLLICCAGVCEVNITRALSSRGEVATICKPIKRTRLEDPKRGEFEDLVI